MFTSMVGNDNHRMLRREEFRGFTLADEVAPLIFVNTHDDTLAGQIFTFFHELGHVLLERSGIGDEEPAAATHNAVETWCNAFAAEAIVPAADLRAKCRGGVGAAELDRLAARYLCSTLVILLRIRAAALVPLDDFDGIYEIEARRTRELTAQFSPRDGG